MRAFSVASNRSITSVSAVLRRRKSAIACGVASAEASFEAARWRSSDVDEFVEPLAGERRYADNRRTPAVDAGLLVLQHLLEVDERSIGVAAVAFGDDMDVGDFQYAGLDRLHLVAEAGRRDDDGRVRGMGDLDFVLADADRLDDDDVEAGDVENVDGVERGARHAADAPRVAIERMKTPGSSARSDMRMRSPRIEPPE